ncbi:MAG: hypothetical protein A2297_00600 [Elusimicrobia bacterium RIFOXYB2_FULL_48_7]|nr:MAG: hypothetical protein A2297_00600 [Elusimicrobia bacterium RIFOXYB2_FULL_48_7]
MRKYKTGLLIIAICSLVSGAGIFRAARADGQIDSARDLVNQGKYDEAIALLNTLPDTQEKKLALAFAYLGTEKYDEAEKIMLEIVKDNPASLPARYCLGMLYEKKKNSAEAIIQWEKVLLLTQKKELRELASKHLAQLKKDEKK